MDFLHIFKNKSGAYQRLRQDFLPESYRLEKSFKQLIRKRWEETLEKIKIFL